MRTLFCHISKGLLLPSPAGSMRGLFSMFITVRTWNSSGGKTHKSVGTHYCCGTLKLLSLRLAHPEPSNTSSITVQVYLPRHLFPWKFLLIDLCLGKLWFYGFPCLSLQLERQQFALLILFFIYKHKSCWLYSLFSFILGSNDDFQLLICHTRNWKFF